MLRMKRPLITLAIIASMAAGISVFCQSRYKTQTHAWAKRVPTEDKETFEKMWELRRKGDFEAALALALKSVEQKPSDDFLLSAIADTYFERAQADPARKQEWVDLALQYSARALDANPQDIVNVFNAGENYLSAGMSTPKPNNCNWYGKSLEVFERLKADPILKTNWATVEGERVPIKPYRERLDEKIKQVHSLAAGCPSA
jgi:hypothetical protein